MFVICFIQKNFLGKKITFRERFGLLNKKNDNRQKCSGCESRKISCILKFNMNMKLDLVKKKKALKMRCNIIKSLSHIVDQYNSVKYYTDETE